MEPHRGFPSRPLKLAHVALVGAGILFGIGFAMYLVFVARPRAPAGESVWPTVVGSAAALFAAAGLAAYLWRFLRRR